NRNNRVRGGGRSCRGLFKTRDAALTQRARKGLAFVDTRVGIADDARELVRDGAGRITLVAEVPRHADLIHALPVDLEGSQALGYQRSRFDLSACGREYYPIEVVDVELARELGRDFGKTFRLQLRCRGDRPSRCAAAVMLGQTVRGQHVRI